jgi:hypothetical protein
MTSFFAAYTRGFPSRVAVTVMVPTRSSNCHGFASRSSQRLPFSRQHLVLSLTALTIAACGARSHLDHGTIIDDGGSAASGGTANFSGGGSNSVGGSFGASGAVIGGGASFDAGSCSAERSGCSARLPCCVGLECRGDSICAKTRSCESVAAEATAFFAARQDCSTVTDCTEFLNPLGPVLPGEFCCSVPVRLGAALDRYTALLAEWVSLGCDSKEPCCNGDATMDCVGGQCAWR